MHLCIHCLVERFIHFSWEDAKDVFVWLRNTCLVLVDATPTFSTVVVYITTPTMNAYESPLYVKPFKCICHELSQHPGRQVRLLLPSFRGAHHGSATMAKVM